MDTFIVYALAATEEAVRDAGWKPDDDEERIRTGVLIGSGIGGLPEIAKGAVLLERGQTRRLSPFFIPAALINLASGHVSIKYGFKGPNHSVVTACATGAHAIGDAARMIMWDDADVMVAGGTEAAICRLGIAGFAAARALSTQVQRHAGEGVAPVGQGPRRLRHGRGRGHRRARGTRARQEARRQDLRRGRRLRHVRRRPPHHRARRDGDGAFRCMQMAFRRAGMSPDEIDYINAHGTSTPLGDEIELGAVKRLFGDAAYKVSMSSTKSSIGHLLGAAGAVEAIFSIKAMAIGQVPPTLNLDNPSEGCDIDLVPHVAKERQVRRGAVQLVRLRRHQRLADLQEGRTDRGGCVAAPGSSSRVILVAAACGGARRLLCRRSVSASGPAADGDIGDRAEGR